MCLYHTLREELYQKNPFKTWKQDFTNNKYLIASIPFVRNLAEFIGDLENEEKLTSLLHIKSDTSSILISDLEILFKDVLASNDFSLDNQSSSVFQVIVETADQIMNDQSQTIELEDKVSLSIAIRLIAEKYVIAEINDSGFVQTIQSNQTFKLIKEFKRKFPSNFNEIEILEQVLLMTPENIHINSFMYEPILDMSNFHLKDLYRKVSDL